jgi:putative CocE/NonD family hydrolase
VGQYWTSLETWPEFKAVDYYLHADKTATLLPSMPSTEDANVKTSYVYDPSNPVPTMGGNNLPHSIGGSIPCGPLDQSEVDKRSDVLTFQTSAFDVQLPLMGPLMATLYVSSDAKDTDFTVKISDVYPTGEVRLLQDNAVRMRWRDATITPEYLTKGRVYEVNMNVWNTSYIVAPGHALRFSISSSNWPRFSVNPNNGLLLADINYPGTNITATNTLHHSSLYRSKITLPVVEKRSLPEVHVVKEMQTAYPAMTKEYLSKMTTNLNAGLMSMKR